MEKHWEEGGANEGDAAQVWRESRQGKNSGKTGVQGKEEAKRKENKTNKILEITQNKHTMIKITRGPPEVKGDLF